MHRWSTHTFRTMCGIREEEAYLSKVIPCEALRHEFLLDGIFAVTALEMAQSPDAEGGVGTDPDAAARYERMALEYYNRGSAAFRELLSDIPPDIYHLMFIFASAAAVIVLGLPHSTGGGGDDQTALARIVTLAELFNGTILIIREGWDSLVDRYQPFRAALSTKVDSPGLLDPTLPVDRDALPFRLASLDLLDDDTRMALSRLDSVNDEIHGPCGMSSGRKPREAEAVAQQEEEEDEEAARAAAQQQQQQHEMYRQAIFWLKESFAENKMEVVKGYCLSFFVLAGKDFAAAVKGSQALAFFILMHWGVQLDRLGREAWFARTIGRQLVLEISQTLRPLPFSSTPDARDGIAWARQQVGLPT